MRPPLALAALATLAALVAGSFVVVACSRQSTPDPTPAPPASAAATAAAPGPSLGNVMVEVSRRFELAGRAAAANRFELAEFEAGEIGEVFEDEVPRASLPKEGPTAHIPGLARTFLATNAPELQKAAAAKDPKAFADAFAHAAAACNGCHATSGKAFIQVPSVPGKPVPDLDALPTTAH